MEILWMFFAQIIAPMVWLVFFSYAFALSAIKLTEAWRVKQFKFIWLYTWTLCLGVYFFISGMLR